VYDQSTNVTFITDLFYKSGIVMAYWVATLNFGRCFELKFRT